MGLVVDYTLLHSTSNLLNLKMWLCFHLFEKILDPPFPSSPQTMAPPPTPCCIPRFSLCLVLLTCPPPADSLLACFWHCGQVLAIWNLPDPHLPGDLWIDCKRCSLPLGAAIQVRQVHTFVGTKLWVLLWLEARDSMLGSSGSCYTLILRHPRCSLSGSGDSRHSTCCMEKGLGVQAGRSGSRDARCVGSQCR